MITVRLFLLGFIVLQLRAQDLITPCKGEDDCCDGILCGMNEGDCDSHEDCAGHLRCGVDNCIGDGFDSTDDCCWEDPLFMPQGSGDEMVEILLGLKKRIAQAAVFQKCELPMEGLDSISMEECSENSCSAELIGKSFTCNNQNNERACKELLALLNAVIKITAETPGTLLRSTTTISEHTYWGNYVYCDYDKGEKKSWVGCCDSPEHWFPSLPSNIPAAQKYVCKSDSDTTASNTGTATWTHAGNLPSSIASTELCKTCAAAVNAQCNANPQNSCPSPFCQKYADTECKYDSDSTSNNHTCNNGTSYTYKSSIYTCCEGANNTDSNVDFHNVYCADTGCDNDDSSCTYEGCYRMNSSIACTAN